MLIAQTLTEDVPIVTSDTRFQNTKDCALELV